VREVGVLAGARRRTARISWPKSKLSEWAVHA
jgi:hypothetical protein